MNCHTGPGLPPFVMQLADLTITKYSVGGMDNNAYLIAPPRGQVVLIDAANEASTLLGAVGDRELGAVITTHSHYDHIDALAKIMAATGARGFCGTPDMASIKQQTGVELAGVWDSDRISCGAISLAVIGLVGHTPGSITLALSVPGHPVQLFTGDSLFPGGVGKTNSPTDFTSLLGDVTAKLFDRFADDTVVHPGHGDATTLGKERGKLADWRARGW